jgi:hypothetical protein
MSRGDYNPGSGSYGFVTKKCPECYTHLPLCNEEMPRVLYPSTVANQ